MAIRKTRKRVAKKAKTHAKLKKELDKVFSQYIRWAYADDSGMVECYTCNVVKHVKEMHNGHFQSRKHTSTRWHENNCRPQCVKCNMFMQGNIWVYGNKLKSEIGEDKFDEIIQLSNTSVKRSQDDYKEMIEYYKNELNKLM